MQRNFRTWVTDKWYEHRDEVITWTRHPVDYDFSTYFQKNRWTLKRWYQQELIELYAQENAKEIQKEIKRSIKKGNL